MQRNILMDGTGLFMILGLCLGLNGHWLLSYLIMVVFSLVLTALLDVDSSEVKACFVLSMIIFAMSSILFSTIIGFFTVVLSGVFAFHTYIYGLFWMVSKKENITFIALMQTSEIAVVIGGVFLILSFVLPYEAFYFFGLTHSEWAVRTGSILFTIFVFGLNSFLYFIHRKSALTILLGAK